MDKQKFEKYAQIFLEQNSKLNLISKNDEKFLWEKHIIDSLSFENFVAEYKLDISGKTLLDIGSGGGFPAVPIAINYPNTDITALDSIRKKINAIEEIKSELNLSNLHTICERAENIKNKKYDFITSRAVASLKVLIPYAMPLLKNNGYFVVYKSLRAKEEISDAQNVIKKYNAKILNIIEYDLPLTENYTRNLVVIVHDKK